MKLASRLLFGLLLIGLCVGFVACDDDDDDDDDNDVVDDDVVDDDLVDDDVVDDDIVDDDVIDDDVIDDDVIDDDAVDDDAADDDTVEITAGFVYAPPGNFAMGSPLSELGRRDNEMLHYVTFTHAFEIMSTEVTQELFEETMGYDTSNFPYMGPDQTLPVERLSWYDALALANKLSAVAEYAPCYQLANLVCADGEPGNTVGYCKDHGGISQASVALAGVDSVYECEGFRLPTEAEWEHAARAGTSTAFFNGDLTQPSCSPVDPNLDAIGWYCGNVNKITKKVAMKQPNPWGLYDTAGNVKEWVWDWYEESYPGTVTDPEGPAAGHFKVARGGGFRYSGARRCRAAYREAFEPGYRHSLIGTRLARTLPAKGKAVAGAMPAIDQTETKLNRDWPDELPFAFTRPDVGTPLTPQEITDFTEKITTFWAQIPYFNWILWHSHGMGADNPWDMPEYKLYWQDTRAIKEDDVVTFQHVGGADNIMIRTPKIINNAIAGYLASGDATLARVVEQYSKGIVALFDGMMWTEQDPEDFVMARAIFTQNHTYVEDGREAYVDYDPVKHIVYSWNAHTIPNPLNPYWGDIWVRNMRSKDDVPHLFRAVPMLMRTVQDAPDQNVREAAADALWHLQGFAQHIVDSGYYIHTKDMWGDAYIPTNEFGMVADLASFVCYDALAPKAECNAQLTSALIGYGSDLDNDCLNGIGWLYEWVSTVKHYFNWAIVRYFHAAAITNALMVEENRVAKKLLNGMATRVDIMVHDEQGPQQHSEWTADAASFLLVAATAGLPLTSEEARLVMEQYTLSVDHYQDWPYWDLWDPSVPNGTYEYRPGRNGALGTAVRPEELSFLIEYCYAPFRNETGATLVDCDVILDPSQWGP